MSGSQTLDTLSEEQARQLVSCLQTGEASPVFQSRPTFGADLSLLRPDPSLAKHTARPISPMEERGRQEAKPSSFGSSWRPRSRSRKRSSGNAPSQHEEPMPSSSPPPQPSLRERADASRFGHMAAPPPLLRTYSHDTHGSPRDESYQGPRHVSQPVTSTTLQTPARSRLAPDAAGATAGSTSSGLTGIFSRSRRKGGDANEAPLPPSSPTNSSGATPRASTSRRSGATSGSVPSDPQDLSFGCASYKAFDAQYRTLREAKEDEVLISNLMYKSFLDLADPKNTGPGMQPKRTYIPIQQAQQAMAPISPDRTLSERTPRPAGLRRFHTDDQLGTISAPRSGANSPGPFYGTEHQPSSSPLSHPERRSRSSKLRPRRADASESSPIRTPASDPFASAFQQAHEDSERYAVGRASPWNAVSLDDAAVVLNRPGSASSGRRLLSAKSDASLRTKFDPFAVPALPEWAQRANHLSVKAQRSPTETQGAAEEQQADGVRSHTADARPRATSTSAPTRPTRERPVNFATAPAVLTNPALAAVVAATSMARTGSDGPRGMPLRDRQLNSSAAVGAVSRLPSHQQQQPRRGRHAKSGSYSSLEAVPDENEGSLEGKTLLAYDAEEPDVAEIEREAVVGLKRTAARSASGASSSSSASSQGPLAPGHDSWSSSSTYSSNGGVIHSRDTSYSRTSRGLGSHDEDSVTTSFPSRSHTLAQAQSDRPPSLQSSSRDSVSSREDELHSPLTPHTPRVASPTSSRHAPAPMVRGSSLPGVTAGVVRIKRTMARFDGASSPDELSELQHRHRRAALPLSDAPDFGELAMRRGIAAREGDVVDSKRTALPLSAAAHANALDAIQRARQATRRHA